MHIFPMVIEKPTFYTYCTLPRSLHLTIYIYTHLQKFGIQEQSDSTELCIHCCTPASTDSASHMTNTMEVTLHSSSSAQKQSVFWNKPTELPTFMVARGGARRCDSGEGVRRLVGEDGYVSTAQHEDLLARMMQSHTTGDFCVVGGKVHTCVYVLAHMHIQITNLVFWSVFTCPPFSLLAGHRKSNSCEKVCISFGL